MSNVPQQICPRCKRPLDDHQLRSIAGPWLQTPICVEPGDITAGVRYSGGKQRRR